MEWSVSTLKCFRKACNCRNLFDTTIKRLCPYSSPIFMKHTGNISISSVPNWFLNISSFRSSYINLHLKLLGNWIEKLINLPFSYVNYRLVLWFSGSSFHLAYVWHWVLVWVPVPQLLLCAQRTHRRLPSAGLCHPRVRPGWVLASATPSLWLSHAFWRVNQQLEACFLPPSLSDQKKIFTFHILIVLYFVLGNCLLYMNVIILLL